MSADTILEWSAVATSLLSVWLTVRRNIWCWPTGIVGALLFGIFFFRIRLYADSGLQVFFIATSIYGWYAWLHGGEHHSPLPMTMLSARARTLFALAVGLSVPLVYFPLVWWTDASRPLLDTTAAVLSVYAQILLMRKIWDNWVLWIIIDVLSIGLYLSKGVYVTTGLYVLFLILATSGMWAWRKQMRTQMGTDLNSVGSDGHSVGEY